jgi:ABC-type lipoprotein export system ATPase subunit
MVFAIDKKLKYNKDSKNRLKKQAKKMENVIENKIPNVIIRDLNVTYNKGKSNEVRSLEEIDLEILPQEYVIIFGPSGCGKSTLLYSIAGLQKPTSGTVLVDGEDINTYGKKKIAWFHRRKIGMIFQSFHLIGSLNVLDNICLPKTFDRSPTSERKQKARELLDRFSITNQADKFPAELSGGQQQRVSIARSLINNPDIILADEPVGNLDSKSAHTVMSILKELNEVDKKTVILVTHDPAHLQYGDKIVHMVDGKITKIDLMKKKQGVAESFIFKDGKIREDLIREEYVPLDLRHLMRSFRGLSGNQISSLLVPFKAQQLFSHLFFSLTNDQIEKALKKVEDFLYARTDFGEFSLDLDLAEEKGGAGWDKRMAENFSQAVKNLVDEANLISFSEKEQSAARLAQYFETKLTLGLAEAEKQKLAGIVLDRLENRIGKAEFQALADLEAKKGGLALNRQTAAKLSREMEMLLLMRYSK